MVISFESVVKNKMEENKWAVEKDRTIEKCRCLNCNTVEIWLTENKGGKRAISLTIYPVNPTFKN